MKKQRWTSLVFLVVIAVIVIACATAAQPTQALTANLTGPLAEASNNTPLLFLGNKNIAPVVFLDGTTPTGVAVDIVHALAKHLSQPVEIKAMDWSEAQALVARGDADALIQINPTEERKKVYDFSDPLLESHFSIFTRADRMGISGLSSLRGLRVGVGVEAGGLPQQVLEKDPQILLIIIPNFTEGFRQLNEGSLDAVVVDYRVGSYILATNNIRNIKVTGEPIASSYSSIAVKKGNTQLLNEINTALQIIKADGTYEKIIKQWQPKETVFETREQITERNYLYTILILLLLFLIAGIWMVSIKKELTKRKVAEEKLKEQYSTLRGIIDSADALIFSVDMHYRYTSFNRGHTATMKAIYGAEIETGHSILEYMTVEADRETARHNLDRALAGEYLVEEAYSGEKLRSRKYFRVSHSPIRIQEEVIGVAVLAHDMTGRKQAEKERLATIFFFESMDKVNQAIQGTNDLEQMMRDVLDTVLSIFDCDRAWLLYPCDPEAASWQTPMERTKPEYPGAYALGLEIPMDEGVAESFRALLASDGPVKFGPETGHSLPENISNQFGFKSFMSMALHPKIGKAWQFGLHQCSYPRIWTPDEEKLLQEIGRRLTDALTSLLTYRNLKESERKFRAIFDQTFEFIGLMTPDGTLLEANRTSLKFGGQQESDVLGKPIWETPWWTHSEELQEKLRAAVQDAAQGEFVRFEVTHLAADGSLHYIDFSIKPVRDEAGRVILLIPEGRDVTERKRAEDALRKSGREWQTTFNAITDAVFLLDNEGRIIRHNRAFEIFTGKPADEIDGRYCYEVMHGTDSPVEGCPNVKAQKSRQRESIELKIGNRWVIVAVDPIISENGKYSGAVHLLIDITERKLAEEALQESEERFRNIFTYAAEGILIADISTQEFLYANPAICTMLGYSAQELTSMRMGDIHPEKDLAHVQEEFMAQARGEKTLAENIPVLRKDGAVLYMDIRTTPVIIDGHRCNIGMFTDITGRRRMENALQLARSKINLLNTVTFQDIQTAAFSITAYHELLRTLVTEEKTKTFLEKQMSANQKIIDTLNFAKNYQDMGVRPPQWLNIGQVFLMAISHLDFCNYSAISLSV